MKKITFYDSIQNQPRKKRWLDCLSFMMVFFMGQFLYAQEYQHLQIATGLTQDVIANGVGAANVSTTSGVDVVNYAFVSADFQATVSSPVLTFGLPVNGLITSAAAATPNLTFQLAPYGVNNSLKLEAINSSSILTFSNDVEAKKLILLVTSGSGISTFTGVITFDDNTTQAISSSTVPDWFNSTTLPVAISGIGRVNTTNNTTENPAGNPRMYQLEIPILVANQTKTIESIQITKTSAAGNAVNIFAITAELLGACPSPDALTTSVSTTSATVSWSIPAIVPTGGYQYYYSDTNTPPTGSTVPSGTLLGSATSVALTPLLPTQNYYFWIRSDCGNNEYGTWQFTSFTTATPGHIGGSSSATNTQFPINSCFGYNYSQQIYLASELQAVLEPGNNYITEIRFKSTSLPTTPANFTSWTVYMGNTTQNEFANNTSWIPNLTPVFTGDLTFIANGWVSIVLNTGFVWDGTSNLVIGVDENTPNYSCTANWAAFPSGSNRGILYYSDSTNPDPASPPTANYGPNANIAQIQIQSTVLPNCLPPTSVVISNVTFQSADLDWTPLGTETEWQYVVGASTATSPDALTPITVNGLPEASINTGLDPITTYKVWIRANCGAEYSPWTGPYTFKTLCSSFVNYSSNFEGFSTGATSPMPDCWSKGGNGSTYLVTGSVAPMSPVNRLYMFASGSATPPTEAVAILPSFSNLQANTHRLKFKAYATAVDRTLDVGYLTIPNDVSSFVFLQQVALPSTAANTAIEFIIIPGALPAGVEKLAIRNSGIPTGSTTAHIDDVVWEAIPTCAEPSELTATTITNSTAMLGWTEANTAIAWEIEYGAPGFAIGTGTIVDAPTNPFELTGLTANMNYVYYVRAVCSPTDSSYWTGPFPFKTQCDDDTVITMTFDGPTGATIMPDCWSRLSTGTTYVTTGGVTPMAGNRLIMTGSPTTEAVAVLRPLSNLSDGTHRLRFLAYASAAERYLEVGYLTDPLDVSTYQVLFDYQLPATAATAQQFYFTPLAGQIPAGVKHLAIKNPGYPPAVSTTLYIDNVYWEAIPSCPEPTSMSVGAITATSAQLTWTEGGAATAWNIEWGIAGFTPTGIPNILETNTNPHNLTGLNPNTAYSYYVQASCGGTSGTSVWVGPFNFTTPCVPYTIPYFEGFESGYIHNTAVSGCFSQSSVTGTAVWTANNTLTTYNRAPRTGGWNAFLQYGNEDWLFVPIELVGGTSYTVELYARQDGATAANSNMLISYGTNATAVAMTNTIVPATGIINGNYQQIIGSFTPASSGVYYVGIKGFMNSTPWYISLDDISIDVTPACVAPTNLSVSNVTSESANLGWSENGTATVWDIEWGTAGFTPTGTPSILGTTTNPHVLTGLDPNTAYSFYVRTNCGGTNGESTWSGPFNFTTTCVPYTIPYFEGFESGYTHNTAVLGCLVQTSVTGTAVWTANNTLTSYNRAPRTGGWNAFLQYGNEDWLFVPIELVGGTSYTVELYARQDGATATNSNMLISYGTDATAVAMTNTIVPATGIINGNYQQITGAFTPIASGVYYVGIKGFMNGTPWYISLDDISIDVSPACVAPTNLSVSNVTSDSVNLGWTENGTASAWDIEWGTAGFSPTGTPTILGTTTNPHVLTGLDPNTAYSFYVRTNCGGTNGESTWSGPFNFTTACIATTVPYVMDFETATVPALPNCTSIENVGTGNLWTVANNPGYGFTTKTLQYLYNSSNAANVWFFTQALNLTAGTTYTIAFDYGSNSADYVEKLKVAYGTSANAVSMTNVVVDLPSISNDTPLNSSTEFTPTATGVYYFGFNVYSIANQYNLYVDNINVQVSLSTGGFDTDNFKCYPNPVTDVLTVSYSNTISEVAVFNLVGQQVLTAQPNATQTQLDLSGLTAGTYLVKVTSDEVTKTVKVVKN